VLPLVPNSGIQFFDFDFEAETNTGWGFFDPVSVINNPHVPPLVDEGEGDGVALSYSLKLKDILEMFERVWMPLPMLRREARGHFHGPTNWARGYLVSLTPPEGRTLKLRLVVAIDTNLLDYHEGDAYLAPSAEDTRSGRQFELPEPDSSTDWYLDLHWIRSWCLGAYRDMVRRRKEKREVERAASQGRKPRIIDPPEDEEIHQAMIDRDAGSNEHLSRYRAYLELLHEHLPRLRVEDVVSEGAARPIGVTLVLDMGNSRSCGLLIEADTDGQGRIDLEKSTRLQLRDLDRAEMVYSQPFPSRIEFSYAHFGPDSVSTASGRDGAFSWPSPVRVGVEAARLSARRSGTEGATGLSTPKRYLWDDDQPADSWRFNGRSPGAQRHDFAVDVPLTSLVNESGKALHRLPENDPDEGPAHLARYARQNLASFAIAEIITHSVSVMNSAAYRLRKPGNASRPRRLDSVIMTIPAAMPIAERRILEEQTNAGCELAFIGLGLAEVRYDDDSRPKIWFSPSARPDPVREESRPKVVIQWDEATATQAVYLYAQIAQNHSGDARAFFRDVRLPQRKDAEAQGDSLRVATIDLGGGTTDLVITLLQAEGRGANVSIKPSQEFREGFNLAGDDALLQVIREHVIEPIRKVLQEHSGDLAGHILKRMFGPNHGEHTTQEYIRRQQFTQIIAVPIALQMLAIYEQYRPQDPACDPANASFDSKHPGSPRILGFNDFFNDETAPDQALTAYFEAEISQALRHPFSLADMKFPVIPADIDRTVRSVFKEMLGALAKMVWRHRTDLLILSGRASKLPAVRHLIEESGVLASHRIIQLHQFRVGSWYPFHDANFTIGDPKTTAAVGAMLCLLGNGRLHNFNLRSDLLRPRSTARFFGKLDNHGRLPSADVFYDNLNLDDPDYQIPDDKRFEFRTRMSLGFRQVPEEWWPATRLYTIGYRTPADAERLNARVPLHVSLEVGGKVGKDTMTGDSFRLDPAFRVASIEDHDGSDLGTRGLRLRLQTLGDEQGYWVDTGILLGE
jgi:hypothetical protein